MKTLLAILMLALASLAIPTGSAALPVQCSLGPFTPGGDTDCRAEVGPCDAHTHMYDVEDALNIYEAYCYECGARLGGGGIRCELLDDVIADPTPTTVTSAAIAPPEVPCYSGIAGSWCTVGAFDCQATVGYQTGGQAYQYAGAYCGRDLWYPCVIAYADTRGNVESCLVATTLPPIASSAAAAEPGLPCQDGIAQTWCDVSVGPCDVRVVPWTAWGDQSVVGDCSRGITRCHVEAHTQDPLNPEHWCAF